MATLEQQVNSVLTKLDMFIEESRAAREKQDEIRQDMKAMQSNLDAKIESIGQHVRNMSIVTMIGIAAMVVAVFLK